MSEAHDPPDLGGPPEAPEVPRRIRLYPAQWVGIPALMLLPILALFNLYGPAREHAEITGAELRMSLDYPLRLRTGHHTDLRVEVRNLTDSLLDSVRVVFDSAYLGAFADIHLTPAAGPAYVVELPGLAPGETRQVRVELGGDRPWRQEGIVSATSGGPDTLRHRLRTFLFP